jgi:hypothetical protein
MPRSGAAASGAIASMVSPCLPWRKLLSPTERLPLGSADHGGGMGERGPSRKTIGSGPAARFLGAGRPARAERAGGGSEGRGLGCIVGAWSRRKVSLARPRPFDDGHHEGSGEVAAASAPSWDSADWKFNGFWRLKPDRMLRRFWAGSAPMRVCLGKTGVRTKAESAATPISRHRSTDSEKHVRARWPGLFIAV